jgi:hypothetical protein
MPKRSNTIPQSIREQVLKVMDSLGGDDFAYYNIDPKSIVIGTERSNIKFYMKVLVSRASRESATSAVRQNLLKNNIGFSEKDEGGNRIDVAVEPGDPTAGIIRLDIKPIGGGSGAGAAETAKNEAGQALFCALRFMSSSNIESGKYSESDLKEAMKKCELRTGTRNLSMDEVLSVGGDWIHSHIVGANLIYQKLHKSGKTYTFHRGSTLVSKIEDLYKKCNKNSGSYFSDINKWSPADIYISTSSFDMSDLENGTETLEVLNAKMQDLFDSGDLMGISLKKITSNNGKYSIKNHKNYPKDISQISYRGIKSTFKSIDLYVKWGPGQRDEIQFRNTGGDKLQWQGEIKGVSAAQGKVGGGVVDSILQNLGHESLGMKMKHDSIKRATDPTNKTHAAPMSKKIYDLCAKYRIDGFKSDTQHLTEIGNSGHSWRYSKYINLKLLEIMDKMSSSEKDEFIQALYFYAGSQSKVSCIYAKVE